MKPSYITHEALKTFITSALKEDIQDGDHSTIGSISADLQDEAKLLVKENCILAGVELAEIIFKQFDPNLQIEFFKKDGDQAQVGDIAFVVKGLARSILHTERLVLNCMQRMSGIATKTHDWNQRLIGTKTQLLDTRKTTPNFRLCEKWAVVIGGGHNHRFGLYDMVMLKDNHIDYNGSIKNAVAKTLEYLKKHSLDLEIEVETRNLAEVQEAIETEGITRIMLDNMDLETMKQAVKMINKQCQTEASGGITRDKLQEIAQTGVDYISAGALIHSAENIDLSLKALR